ncbi:MAG: TetR/AcrR family transcriptional regulator [Gammaproteobacteria bacterium]|nr:TetR/AcrR family transcriptional regulator [Gammaproteobacteria bacterium]
MSKSKQSPAQKNAKKSSILDAAANVFAQYGFKRTTMNDIATAAGISRPALYLMFENKEHLFTELAGHRIKIALKEARAALLKNQPITTRFIDGIKTFERTYTEPVASSPHGDELIDVNANLASDIMIEGRSSLVAALVKELKTADQSGEVNFQNNPLSHKAFVELLLSSISGVKKSSASKAEYRKKTRQVIEVFLKTIRK